MTESGPEEGEITYNVFQDAVEAGAIAEVTIKPNDEISGRFTTEGAQRFGEGQEEFATSGPTQDLVDTLYVTGANCLRNRNRRSVAAAFDHLAAPALPLSDLLLFHASDSEQWRQGHVVRQEQGPSHG